MKKVVQVEVSEKAHDLGQALVSIVSVSKQALADGFQPGTDLPVVVLAAASQIVKVVEGIQSAGDELKEDQAAFIAALGLSAKDLAGVLLKK